MWKYSQGIWLSMDKRYGKEVTGACKICQAKGKTEMHHIISQSKIKMIERPDLMTNPANIIELCKKCHNLTDSSSYRRLMIQHDPNRKSRGEKIHLGILERRKKEGVYQCEGHVVSGRRCRKPVTKEGGYCRTHLWQTYKELVESNEIPNDYP